MEESPLDAATERLIVRFSSPRCHFVGFLCFWSLWMLSISFWKAALIGSFVALLMIFQLERRIITTCVLVLALFGALAFIGISFDGIKNVMNGIHVAAVVPP